MPQRRALGLQPSQPPFHRAAGEFQIWFRTDEDYLDDLEWLRWPGGFTCPRCGHGVGWRLGDGGTEFARCSSRTSVTAGTIVDRTRKPLTIWFTACWLFATQKDGISALSLQRALEIGSYQTAWAMPGRPRSVLVRPGRDRLSGTAEVDETYIGGEEPGLGCGQPPRSAAVFALHRTRADYAAWRGASQLREASLPNRRFSYPVTLRRQDGTDYLFGARPNGSTR